MDERIARLEALLARAQALNTDAWAMLNALSGEISEHWAAEAALDTAAMCSALEAALARAKEDEA